MRDSPFTKIKYAFEFLPLAIMLGFFHLMTPERASKIAGRLGRQIGPRLATSRKALVHLKMAIPGKTDTEYAAIIKGMWDNLARIVSEYPNLAYLASQVELVGIDHLKMAFEETEQVILFSGHVGNWEIMAPALLEYGLELDLVYRAPNNPWSDKALDYFRSMKGKLLTIPKSKSGTRLLVDRMQNGNSIGILIDQKYNEGLAVPFFGYPAMTSPAFALLAQKYNCPLIPFRVERLKDTSFRLSFFEPLKTVDSNGENLLPETIIAEAHALLEGWIKERPEQWLWLHRRWINRKNPGKKAAAKMSQSRPASPQTPAS